MTGIGDFRAMKISSEMIDPELRWTGRVMRLLLRPRTVGAFRRMDRLNRIMLKGRKPNDLACSEVWIPRRDGGQLRVVVSSDEHTSELQSLMRTPYAVFCLKNKKT